MSFTLVGAVGPLCNSFGRYGLACLAAWVPVGCVPARFVLPNGRFHTLKRPVRQARTGRIAVASGARGGVGAAFVKKIISASSRHRAGWLTGPAVAFQCLAPMPTACRRGRPRGQSGCKIIQFWPKRKMCQALFSCRLAMAAVADGAYIHYIYVSLAGGYSRAGFRKRGVACAVCCQWRHGRGSPDVMALPADM